ncbi:DUF2750 domain-containing protein [uncultured Ruminobacter sp.]|jgi:hypothetical protein|uniref:DUF2750 domain-containing protein n=1 Tax=uncultured Ruminobacter sp. TaxID=538947 RepID=UPI0025F09072|nr:DUF2750 domain-containing protein [uncultured Ruminobacter sp.]
MSYQLTDREYQAALKLNADYRYQYFTKNIQKGLELFVLKNSEGILFMETEGDEENSAPINVIPVWCHENYAKYYAEQNVDVADYEPQSISLAIFIERWAENLESSNIELAIFPLTNTDCNIVKAKELIADLNLDDENA